MHVCVLRVAAGFCKYVCVCGYENVCVHCECVCVCRCVYGCARMWEDECRHRCVHLRVIVCAHVYMCVEVGVECVYVWEGYADIGVCTAV